MAQVKWNEEEKSGRLEDDDTDGNCREIHLGEKY